ncbi:MAG: TIGR01777 family oxidoreductase [Simkaniaceae bacterium]|nr:TIGR01777 family oxidoreductase [Simkaniaceae bacterium]
MQTEVKERVLVTGSHGLIGEKSVSLLRSKGYRVLRVVRRKEELSGDASLHVSDPGSWEGAEIVLHLAGENVGIGYWTKSKKREIAKSRIEGTQALVAFLSGLHAPPKHFICASAVGYYGDTKDRIVTEKEGAGGTSFLTDLCVAWEREARKAERFGSRVVLARLGTVLSSERKGFLQAVRPLCKMGVGGVMGSGKQYVSWVADSDAVGALHHILSTRDIRGPVNVTSPHPVTNRELMLTLTRILRRPCLCPLPSPLVSFLLGEKGRELILRSTRAIPEKLLASGYSFRFPRLTEALETMLK